MKVDWTLDNAERNPNSVLTVGTFDGVHKGHRFILEEIRKRSVERGAQTTVVTFNPHPQIVLQSPNRSPVKILTTIDEKLDILEGLKIDRTVVIEFTEPFSRTSPVDFVRNDLYNKIGFSEIVIGHDHAFGKNRQGDIGTLRALGAELDFKVAELPPYEATGEIISSTKTRELLSLGDIKTANDYLGRVYSLKGVVVQGDGRGKALGFPTANLSVTKDKLIPRDGVYAVFVKLDASKLRGMMNIGVRPTFHGSERAVEVHIFDFDESIYGETLQVEFVERIRDEVPFVTTEALVKQLHKDKMTSLKYL